MKAEAGKTYAQIINGKCHWIFTVAELPEWNNDDCPAVDVTGSVPSIGDAYEVATGKFTAPDPVGIVTPVAPADSVAKLAAFIAANPDVAAMLA